MKKDSTIYLRNMVDKANEALLFCSTSKKEDFLNNGMLQSAVVMKLIVIGEEARKLPPEITEAIDLPWRMIMGFRNMAVHEYFNLDMSQVWVTVQEDLPTLTARCSAYLGRF